MGGPMHILAIRNPVHSRALLNKLNSTQAHYLHHAILSFHLQYRLSSESFDGLQAEHCEAQGVKELQTFQFSQ